ncbi:MAG: endonuclease domain-containing protein [Polyangiaceae bacterium]
MLFRSLVERGRNCLYRAQGGIGLLAARPGIAPVCRGWRNPRAARTNSVYQLALIELRTAKLDCARHGACAWNGVSPAQPPGSGVIMQKPSLRSARRRQLLAVSAASMRRAPSWPERKLFAALRGGRLGVRVTRQVVLGEFVVDLLVPAAHLVIEVDGPHHSRKRNADSRRDRALARMGYRVLRVSAAEVCDSLDAAVARVWEALKPD